MEKQREQELDQVEWWSSEMDVLIEEMHNDQSTDIALLSLSVKSGYQQPIISSSGRSSDVLVEVKKDNNPSPLKPMLQSLDDLSGGKLQTALLTYRLRDRQSGNTRTLCTIRVGYHSENPGKIVAMDMDERFSLESTPKTAWTHDKIDSWRLSLRDLAASNDSIKLNVEDIDVMTKENRLGLLESMRLENIEPSRLTIRSNQVNYNMTEQGDLTLSKWKEGSQKFRDNPEKIVNLNHCCPLTLEPIADISDKVLASDGHFYESSAWNTYTKDLQNKGKPQISPVNRQPIEGILPPAESERLYQEGLKRQAEHTAKNNPGTQAAGSSQENRAESTQSGGMSSKKETPEQRQQLREQQDEAYQESLKADMAKQQANASQTPKTADELMAEKEEMRQIVEKFRESHPIPDRTVSEAKVSKDSNERRLTDQGSETLNSVSENSQSNISKEELRQKRLDAIAKRQSEDNTIKEAQTPQNKSQTNDSIKNSWEKKWKKDASLAKDPLLESPSTPQPKPLSRSQSSQSATPAKGSSSKQAAPSVEMPGKGYRLKEPTMMEKAEDAFFGQDARFDKERNAYYQNYSPNKPEEIAAESKAIEITPTTNALPERQEWVDQQQGVLDGLNKDKRAASSSEPSSPQPKPSPGSPNHGKDIDDDLPSQNATAQTDTLSPRPDFTSKGPTEKEMADVALMARPESPTKEFPPTIPRLVE